MFQNLKFKIQNSTKGFSLLELLVASGISSTVLLVAFGTVGQFYFAQKKINYSQDFYNESRFLMERMVKLSRDNTLDYDRFFAEVGPDPTQCSSFFAGAGNETDNDIDFREQPHAYEKVFFWDTDNDAENKPDRNLGGVDMTGTIDLCAQAFQGTLDELYLINGNQTVQTAFRRREIGPAPARQVLQMQVRLGYDTTNDGRADTWEWNIPADDCTIGVNPPLGAKMVTEKEEFCARAHDWTTISPKALEVINFTFHPSPDRDPFLNFRNDSVQIHPHVFLSLDTKLADAESNGIETEDIPKMLLQTTASSRIFGDIRK